MDLLRFVRGCTFDDFLFAPQKGILPRRDPDVVDLSCKFSENLTLKRPIISAEERSLSSILRSKLLTALKNNDVPGRLNARGLHAVWTI
jgi:hypothetical protein